MIYYQSNSEKLGALSTLSLNGVGQYKFIPDPQVVFSFILLTTMIEKKYKE